MQVLSKFSSPNIDCPYCESLIRPSMEDMHAKGTALFWFECPVCGYEIEVNALVYPKQWRDYASME